MSALDLKSLTLLELAMIYALVEGSNPFQCAPTVLADIDLELDSRPNVLVGEQLISPNAAFDAIYQHFENGATKDVIPKYNPLFNDEAIIGSYAR